MKKRVNITIGEKLHQKAVEYAHKEEMDFSELVSFLLRDALHSAGEDDNEGLSRTHEVRIGNVLQNEGPVPRKAPAGFRLMRDGERPAKNAPCPCGSGQKYKRCCAARAPYIRETSS